MWRNLRPYPDAKLQPWPLPSASARGSSLHDAFAVRRLIQPRLSERQPRSRVGDVEREARERVEPGCRRRRHRSAGVAPCRIAEARSQARGPSSVAALAMKESSRGGRAHDRSAGKGVAGVGRRRRARSWRCNHADPGALTIAFVERAVRCLRGSSKHRRILPRSANVDRDGCVTPQGATEATWLVGMKSGGGDSVGVASAPRRGSQLHLSRPTCDSANSASSATRRVGFPALGHARYAGTSRSAVNPCRRTTSSRLLAFIAAHAPYDKQPQDGDDREPPRS